MMTTARMVLHAHVYAHVYTDTHACAHVNTDTRRQSCSVAYVCTRACTNMCLCNSRTKYFYACLRNNVYPIMSILLYVWPPAFACMKCLHACQTNITDNIAAGQFAPLVFRPASTRARMRGLVVPYKGMAYMCVHVQGAHMHVCRLLCVYAGVREDACVHACMRAQPRPSLSRPPTVPLSGRPSVLPLFCPSVGSSVGLPVRRSVCPSVVPSRPVPSCAEPCLPPCSPSSVCLIFGPKVFRFVCLFVFGLACYVRPAGQFLGWLVQSIGWPVYGSVPSSVLRGMCCCFVLASCVLKNPRLVHFVDREMTITVDIPFLELLNDHPVALEYGRF